MLEGCAGIFNDRGGESAKSCACAKGDKDVETCEEIMKIQGFAQISCNGSECTERCADEGVDTLRREREWTEWCVGEGA